MIIKTLRHSVFHHNVFYKYEKFYDQDRNIKRDISFQKIKVKKSIFKFLTPSVRIYVISLNGFLLAILIYIDSTDLGLRWPTVSPCQYQSRAVAKRRPDTDTGRVILWAISIRGLYWIYFNPISLNVSLNVAT